MEIFKIEIQEILSRIIDIEANDVEEALETANKMYENFDVILDYDDLKILNIVPRVLNKND